MDIKVQPIDTVKELQLQYKMMHENSKHKHNYREWKKKNEKKGTKLDKQELCPAISTHACIGTLLTKKPKVTLQG